LPPGQIVVTAVSAPTDAFAEDGSGTTFMCTTPGPNGGLPVIAGFGAYLVVESTEPAIVEPTALTIVWAGQTNAFAPEGACPIGSGVFGTTAYIGLADFADLSSAPVQGGSFTGTVTFSNGIVVIFSGTFQ